MAAIDKQEPAAGPSTYQSVIPESSNNQDESESEDETTRRAKNRGSRKVKVWKYDEDEEERILEYRKEQEQEAKILIFCTLHVMNYLTTTCLPYFCIIPCI
ncbi:hypothetical protein ACF0H5_010041 [Mactra antiquata]